MNKSILNAMKRLPCAEKENNKTVKCGKNANFPAYGLWPLESPLLLLLLLLPVLFLANFAITGYS